MSAVVGTHYGRLLHTIDIAPGPDVRLIAREAWPAGVPQSQIVAASSDLFAYPGSISLLLFQVPQSLDLTPTGTFQSVQNHFATATLQDVVTLKRSATVQPYDGEAVLDTSLGSVIARPMGTNNLPLDIYFVDDADRFGWLDSVNYTINPGKFNDAWPAHAPEPGTAVLLAIGALLLPGRRPRPRTSPDVRCIMAA
jgi:hypothetical protein